MAASACRIAKIPQQDQPDPLTGAGLRRVDVVRDPGRPRPRSRPPRTRPRQGTQGCDPSVPTARGQEPGHEQQHRQVAVAQSVERGRHRVGCSGRQAHGRQEAPDEVQDAEPGHGEREDLVQTERGLRLGRGVSGTAGPAAALSLETTGLTGAEPRSAGLRAGPGCAGQAAGALDPADGRERPDPAVPGLAERRRAAGRTDHSCLPPTHLSRKASFALHIGRSSDDVERPRRHLLIELIPPGRTRAVAWRNHAATVPYPTSAMLVMAFAADYLVQLHAVTTGYSPGSAMINSR